jgi:hypothetical protein
MIGEGCIGLLAKASDQSHDRRGMNQVRQQAASYGGVCSRVDGPGTGRDLHLAPYPDRKTAGAVCWRKRRISHMIVEG